MNVEWWFAGVLAAVLGGSPVLGFHALRVLAIVALLAAAARLLAAAGVVGRRLAWALVLVATAGGLGWLRLLVAIPGSRVPDILMGLYPFHQSLMNAHFVVASAMFAWTLVLHLEWRRRAPLALGLGGGGLGAGLLATVRSGQLRLVAFVLA